MDAPLVTAFVLLFSFTGVIGIMGKRRARGLPGAPAHDRSSAVLGVMHTASMLTGGVFPSLGVGTLPLSPAFGWAADVGMALAFGLQMWAMSALGAHFSLALSAAADQPVIERGPYRIVRHPGYLGQLLLWLAFGIATRNAVALAVIAIGAPIAYGYRIRVEERMLVATLAERYESYARGRARLVPGLW